jgi:SAM-dependent methyltransferase
VTPIFALPTVAFFGRSLAEYQKFFALDMAKLRNKAVLDVGAGPASFAAEAEQAWVNVVALDPLYTQTPAALAAQVQRDYDRMFAGMRDPANADRFQFKSFASIDEAEQDRRRAAEVFLADYARYRERDRYREASLPHLPVADRSFDLVLCAHLFFLHDDVFDYAFHLTGCRELMRVARDEVRIHPTCGADGQPHPHLPRLIEDLAAEGITAEVVSVDYEFFAGAHSMLVLKRAE